MEVFLKSSTPKVTLKICKSGICSNGWRTIGIVLSGPCYKYSVFSSLFICAFQEIFRKPMCVISRWNTHLKSKLYPCPVTTFSSLCKWCLGTCTHLPVSPHHHSSRWHLLLKIRSAWPLPACSWVAEALSGAASWGPPLREEDRLAPRQRLGFRAR